MCFWIYLCKEQKREFSLTQIHRNKIRYKFVIFNSRTNKSANEKEVRQDGQGEREYSIGMVKVNGYSSMFWSVLLKEITSVSSYHTIFLQL